MNHPLPTVEDRVRSIVSRVTGVDHDAIEMENAFGDFTTDPLEVAQVVIDCEDEFGVLIPDEIDDAPLSLTVRELVAAVTGRREAA